MRFNFITFDEESSDIIIIIIICQVCCRHRRSWPPNPLCRQLSWWAHCWEILFLLRNYSDCLCILCVVFLCLWYRNSFHSTLFVFLVHQLCLYAKKCSCLFLMVLNRDLLYPAISITSPFDFFSVHDILIILLMYHISAAPSLLSRSLSSRRMDPM